MTDISAVVERFPGVDEGVLAALVDEPGEPTPADVAAALDHIAGRGGVPPGDYAELLRRQVEAGAVVVTCDECGKHFTGETADLARQKANGHKSSHRVRDGQEGDEPPTPEEAVDRLEADGTGEGEGEA